MKNIFVYGTLLFEDVWNRVVRHRYEKLPAILPGYKRLSIKGKNYPGLVKSFNSSVEGVVYFDVTAQDIKRLDKFEGRYYRKIPVRVLCKDGHKVNARAYVFNRRNRRLLGTSPWCPLNFQARYLSRFIARYRGF
ncbi:MAG: gamma-glutamylcyclotransferase [Gammaproteobacteria bacterium]|nr:gamma-glutamylcyclotransferase [Gammaproteobacteria bacterium]